MRTTIGKELLESFNGSALAEIATAARHRAAILRETSNANRASDADRFEALATAIDELEGEGF